MTTTKTTEPKLYSVLPMLFTIIGIMALGFGGTKLYYYWNAPPPQPKHFDFSELITPPLTEDKLEVLQREADAPLIAARTKLREDGYAAIATTDLTPYVDKVKGAITAHQTRLELALTKDSVIVGSRYAAQAHETEFAEGFAKRLTERLGGVTVSIYGGSCDKDCTLTLDWKPLLDDKK